MTQLLAYPFSVTPGGTIATVEAGTTEQYAQELTVLILTNLGERPLVPRYGIPDPAFRGLRLDDVRTAVEIFGPPVDVVELRHGDVVGARQEVEVIFDG